MIALAALTIGIESGVYCSVAARGLQGHIMTNDGDLLNHT